MNAKTTSAVVVVLITETIFPRIYARTYYVHPRARVMSFSGTLPSASFLTFSYLFELMTGSEVHEQQISSLHNTLARTDDDGIDDQLCRIHSVNLLSMSLVSLLAHSLGSNTRTRIWLPLPQRSIQFDEDETWRDSRRLATGTTKRAILHCTSALCATPHTHAGQRR